MKHVENTNLQISVLRLEIRGCMEVVVKCVNMYRFREFSPFSSKHTPEQHPAGSIIAAPRNFIAQLVLSFEIGKSTNEGRGEVGRLTLVFSERSLSQLSCAVIMLSQTYSHKSMKHNEKHAFVV